MRIIDRAKAEGTLRSDAVPEEGLRARPDVDVPPIAADAAAGPVRDAPPRSSCAASDDRRAADELRAGSMRPDIVPGGTLPDYGLIDWGRPTNDDLRRDLREVTRAIRPDWDLAAPGLRERWDAATRRVLAVRAAGERADRRAGGPCSDL